MRLLSQTTNETPTILTTAKYTIRTTKLILGATMSLVSLYVQAFVLGTPTRFHHYFPPTPLRCVTVMGPVNTTTGTTRHCLHTAFDSVGRRSTVTVISLSIYGLCSLDIATAH